MVSAIFSQTSNMPPGSIFLKNISVMGSFEFWSQFDCQNFLLEVQKKAACSPKGQIFKQSAGTVQQYEVPFSPEPKVIRHCLASLN